LSTNQKTEGVPLRSFECLLATAAVISTAVIAATVIVAAAAYEREQNDKNNKATVIHSRFPPLLDSLYTMSGVENVLQIPLKKRKREKTRENGSSWQNIRLSLTLTDFDFN
jgi:hypothetical protein